MATPSHPILPGAEDLFSLLAIIQNPKVIKSFFDEYDKRAKGLDARIELVAKARKIEKLVSKAEEDAQLAAKELATAREKASKATKSASDRIKKREEDAVKSHDALTIQLKDWETALQDKEAVLDGREAAVKKDHKEAESKLAKAEKLSISALKIKSEFTERLSALREATREVA